MQKKIQLINKLMDVLLRKINKILNVLLTHLNKWQYMNTLEV